MVAKIKIGTVDPFPAGSFSAAFVLPITRDRRVLLTKEKRGSEIKFGMLGGKPHEAESDFETMSREANEETGGELSKITLARLTRGAGILDGARVFYENSNSVGVKHDLVVPDDLDVDTRFDPRKAAAMASDRAIQKKRKKAKTLHLGLEFVSIESVRDWRWRNDNMHHNPSVLCARLMKLGD
jgi:8-oxo-dGTP pyrophosphatase MutT (NUDIX family)